MLLFKIHLNAFFFELSYRCQTVYGVSSETADGFCNDKVNLAVQSILNHFIEAVSVLCVQSRDAFVRVYGDELPIRLRLDIIGVIIHLCFIARLLFFAVGRDTGITRHTLSDGSIARKSRVHHPCRWDDRYIFCCLHQCSPRLCVFFRAASRISGVQLSALERSDHRLTVSMPSLKQNTSVLPTSTLTAVILL